ALDGIAAEIFVIGHGPGNLVRADFVEQHFYRGGVAFHPCGADLLLQAFPLAFRASCKLLFLTLSFCQAPLLFFYLLLQRAAFTGEPADCLFRRSKLSLQGGTVFFGIRQPVIDILNALFKSFKLSRRYLFAKCNWRSAQCNRECQRQYYSQSQW